MENTNTIKGDVFIVPNAIMCVENCIGKNRKEASERWADFLKHNTGFCCLPADTMYVQVWATTPGNSNSNWADHHELCLREKGRFPTYLPVSLFKDKKEGETVAFMSQVGKIELTLNQVCYRYRRFGQFQQVLKGLVDHMNEFALERHAEWGEED